jgi:hypothetical protein
MKPILTIAFQAIFKPGPYGPIRSIEKGPIAPIRGCK